MLNIHWRTTVDIPQLAALQQELLTLGDKLVSELSDLTTAIQELIADQAAHLTAIEEEIRQLGTNPTQAQLDGLAAQVRDASSGLRAMTDQVKGMVPDEPAPPTP